MNGKEYDLSNEITDALKSEGMTISDLTYSNWDLLVKGASLSINKNKNLIIVKTLSDYSVKFIDAIKASSSTNELEAV